MTCSWIRHAIIALALAAGVGCGVGSGQSSLGGFRLDQCQSDVTAGTMTPDDAREAHRGAPPTVDYASAAPGGSSSAGLAPDAPWSIGGRRVDPCTLKSEPDTPPDLTGPLLLERSDERRTEPPPAGTAR